MNRHVPLAADGAEARVPGRQIDDRELLRSRRPHSLLVVRQRLQLAFQLFPPGSQLIVVDLRLLAPPRRQCAGIEMFIVPVGHFFLSPDVFFEALGRIPALVSHSVVGYAIEALILFAIIDLLGHVLDGVGVVTATICLIIES